METTIRPMQDDDLDAIVELSLLAWEPVFVAWEEILGPEIYPIFMPDWRAHQSEVVINVCRDEKSHRWVAEVAGRVVGFITYTLDTPNERGRTGEVQLLAVHPDYQNQGLGTTLNEFALEKMRESGMEMAVVGTGGDPGHAPARRSYEKAGYTALPVVRYYQKL